MSFKKFLGTKYPWIGMKWEIRNISGSHWGYAKTKKEALEKMEKIIEENDKCEFLRTELFVCKI
jgi:hypothetical protein